MNNVIEKVKNINIKEKIKNRNFFKKKKNNRVKQCFQDNLFDAINMILIVISLLIVILPLLNLLALSFSDSQSTLMGNVFFLPQVKGKFGVSFDSFKYVLGFINNKGEHVNIGFLDMFQDGSFLNSVVNTVKITVIVTIVSNLFMGLCAYPLSKSDCPFKKGIMLFFIIIMLFSPGVIPIYIFMSGIRYGGIQFTPALLGTIWPVVLCSICNVFNMFLYKTFYENVPKDIEESAIIDGASSLKLFFKIIIPLSLPVVASCCFFTVVGCINSYSGALLFIGTDKSGEAAEPMALYIYKLLAIGEGSVENIYYAENLQNITSATIVFSMIPILIIYPFIIKYIKGGVMLGSVKG